MLAPAWLAWMAPFFLTTKGPRAQKLDRRARWGIGLEAIGFGIVWFRPLWIAHPDPWRIAAGALFLVLGPALTWSSARVLGRQWRFDAGLNADHQLVQSGAYRVVRHPIYTSMLCMLIGTGLLIARLPALVIAIAVALVGTEIRVRVEDSLLESRFGEAFREYKRRVPAYLPGPFRSRG